MTLQTKYRYKLISAVHAAKAKAGLDDDAYRDLLETKTGKRSSKDCSTGELSSVLTRLNALTGHGVGPGRFRPSPRADVRKVYALWGEARRRGILRTPGKGGLRSFCARVGGCRPAATDPEFLTPAQAGAVIEALKAMIERE